MTETGKKTNITLLARKKIKTIKILICELTSYLFSGALLRTWLDAEGKVILCSFQGNEPVVVKETSKGKQCLSPRSTE